MQHQTYQSMIGSFMNSPRVSHWVWSGVVAIAMLAGGTAQGQVIPDATLGAGNSSVTTTTGNRTDILGGLRRNSSLFHSFDRFDVLTNQQVYFANPADIRNIFSRVTGGSISNIDGLLGVSGSANLFFMNPNGIIFGPNARLDVAGSFLATTANALEFADNQKFAATGDRAVPLVEVNIPIGVQFGANPPAMLTNRGNLTAGQNLTLAAGNLDLQGQVRSGGNLTLNATDTVRIRDTVTEPFLARSGGDMTIQGNQGIDILALNHPSQTPLVSGGDMRLVSDGMISGDAHYETGGNFSILNTTGRTGNFFSIYDPIITANGNVSFGTYTGISLKVIAAGSITTGAITITGIDATVDPNNPNNPVLTLSAGVNNTNNTYNSNPITFPFTEPPPPISGTTFTNITPITTPPQPGITVNGDISTTLTQPFKVTLSAPGDISTRAISAASNSDTGFGEITLRSTSGSVYINGDLSVSNANAAGLAGNIFIDAASEVNISNSSLESRGSLGFIFIGNSTPGSLFAPNRVRIDKSSLIATNDSMGSGGVIRVTTRGNNPTPNRIDIINSTLQSSSSGSASGGSVSLSIAAGGTLNLNNSIVDASISGSGESGNGVNIAATEATVLLDTNSLINTSTTGSSGAGSININARTLSLKGSSTLSATTATTGIAGSICINAGATCTNNSVPNPLDPATSVSIDDGSLINTDTRINSTGEGGDITINTGSFSLTGGSRVQARTLGSGRAGDIQLNFTNTATIGEVNPIVSSAPVVYSGMLTDTGTTNTGNINNPQTDNSGRGGNITINSPNQPRGSLNLNSGGFLSARTISSNAAAEGGKIEINVNNLSVLSGGQVLTTSLGSANAGSITVNAAGSVEISGSRSASGGQSFLNNGSVRLVPLAPLNFIQTLNQEVEQSGTIPYVTLQRVPVASNTSTTITATTANGNSLLDAGSLIADYYSFSITTDGSRGIFDIDNATINNSIDTQIFLYDRLTGRLLASNDDFYPVDSVRDNNGNITGGSRSGLDSRIAYNFNFAGDYVLAVGRFSSTASNNIPVAPGSGYVGLQNDSGYRLQASLENRGTGNLSFADRNPNQGLNSGLFAQSLSSGSANDITVTANSFALTNRGELSATTSGQANGGNIRVTTGVGTPLPVSQNSILVDNGQIQTSILPPADKTSAGLPSVISGNVTLTAQSGSISLTNSNPLTQLGDSTLVSASTAGLGNAGTVTVQTTGGGSISVLNGARVTSSTTGTGDAANPGGNAGNIVVNAPNITISGSTLLNGQPFYSGLLASSDTANSSQGGDIIINDVAHGAATGQRLQVDTGAFLSTLNRSDLPGGNVTINVDALALINGGQIVTASEGLGRAGNITVNSPNVQISGTNPNFTPPNSLSNGTGNLPWVSGGQTIDVNTLSSSNVFTASANQAIDFSTTAPHVTIQGQGGAYDFYRLDNVGMGNRIVADIDNNLVTAGTPFDTQIFLFDSAGHLLVQNDDSVPKGSARGSTSSLDSYLDHTFTAPGTYFIGISKYIYPPMSGSVALPGVVPAVTVALPGVVPAATNAYTLQLSVDRRNTLNPNQSASSGLVAQSTAPNGAAGNVLINGGGGGQVALNNGAQISGATVSGQGGSITLNGLNTLQVTDSLIATSTSGNNGSAGAISVNAAASVNLSGVLPNGILPPGITPIGGLAAQASQGNGSSGQVAVTTRQLTVQNGAAITASTDIGIGSNIILNDVNTLQINNGSSISASTQTGQAGNLTLNNANNPATTVTLDNGRLSVTADQVGGRAGSITLYTQSLDLQNSSQISATNISAPRSNDDGNITLSGLNNLNLNNSQISSSTRTGQAGNLFIDAVGGNVDLNNNSRFTVAAANGGTAGNLTVTAGRIRVNQSEITVSSPTGPAGNLTLITPDLRLDHGTLSADTGGSGSGANISLESLQAPLIMRNGSLISANAGKRANGGNITIGNRDRSRRGLFPVFIIGPTFEDNDILAKATEGNGGTITITTNAIFGLQFRRKQTDRSDITASSETGNSGTVALNTLNIDPSKGLVELPEIPVDRANQLTQGCSTGGDPKNNESRFSVAGRGGVPASPTAPFTAAATASDWVSLDLSPQTLSSITFSNDITMDLVAQSDRIPVTCVNAWKLQQRSLLPTSSTHPIHPEVPQARQRAQRLLPDNSRFRPSLDFGAPSTLVDPWL